MMEKLVMCGCGGLPRLDMDVEIKTRFHRMPKEKRYCVMCSKCGTIATGSNYDEAMLRWNTAMSGNRVRLHNVIFEDEREPVKPFRDANPKRWRCGNCGSAVKKPWAYCQKCGAKIDWKEEKND